MSVEGKLSQDAGGDTEASPPSPNRGESLELEENDSERGQQKRGANQGQQKKKAKSAMKGKLVRSLAVCEESFPPQSAAEGAEENQDSVELQISSLPAFLEDDEADKTSEKPKIRMLSKDHSQEYTDSTGIDLHEFLVNTLKNNPRDRMMLLKMEQEIIDFIADNNNHYKKFPQMSSYHRMLLHRVAAYFGMDHNVDQTGKSVIINKTSNTRIPEQRFSEHVREEKSDEFQKRFILKRDSTSLEKDDGQSVCSQENLYMDSRILEDSTLFNESQKKRQLFRGNRDSTGKATGSRQSSTETDMRWSDQRPWSSTDSDSSNRNLKPTVTKTASIGGITVLTRGDSSNSTRSMGKLSKTGSESSSSGGSSGSLSRVHQSLQSSTIFSSASISSTGSNSYTDGPGLTGQVSSNSPSYILVPLEATGIPPGSILLNPHTGHPFVNPDGTPAVYNPPNARSQLVGQSSQQNVPTPQQPTAPPTQQQQPIANHITPQRDDMTSQFGQMSLSRQSSGETPESAPSSSVFPPGLLSQPLQQPPSFIIASPSQQLPPGGFSSSGPPLSQQVLQPPPQGYVQQQQPAAQVPVYYYSSSQYPTSASQQFRPVAPIQFSAQRNPPSAGYQPLLSNQQQGFQNLMGMQQPPQNQNLMSSQQGNQVQGMMVQYPAISSYQVPMTQGMPLQSYQQTMMLPSQSGQNPLPSTGIPVYCSMVPPSPPSSLRLVSPHCPSSNVSVVPASCRTNCAGISSTGWQVKY
ncbi:cAMP-regulated phosphoprotein 21 isoform X2 [Erpetoichthys calabaricus]|uniref:cAMP-regulated phosphoprotein 21 isoform X2 n=1 Tax=Erpetoichthys calabaricus TaxID=27687 RepID=UPI002234D406|nr:cAMP-regulated phosphoprotein 21 isoform X2 [Erpetoichthys calabaricus]